MTIYKLDWTVYGGKAVQVSFLYDSKAPRSHEGNGSRRERVADEELLI